MEPPWQIEREDIDKQIKKLTILINETTSNVIALGIYRSVMEREAAIRALKEHITFPIVECALSKTFKNPIHFLRKLDKNERKCVFFYDADEAFPEFLGYINFQRESFADFPHVCFFWVTEPTLVEIGTKAPDFWSWRRGVFDFRQEYIPRTQEFLQSATREDFTFQNLGDIERRIGLYEGMLKEHLAVAQPDERFIAELENKLAQTYKIVANYDEAERYANFSLNRAKKINESELEVNVLLTLGQCAQYKADNEQARKYFLEASGIVEKKFHESTEISYRFNSTIFNELGVLSINVGDAKQAIEYFTKALEIDLKVYGASHPNVATRYNNLGSAWKTLGDAKQAIEYYTKALEIFLKVYGKDHPNIASTYNNLGSAYDTLGDAKQAIEYYTKALEIDLRVYGASHPDVAIDYNNLGSAYNNLGNAKQAIEYYTKALEIDLKVYGASHPNVATRYNNLGLAYDNLGDAKQAIEYYTKALEILLKVYGKDHPSIALTYNNLGSAYNNLGDAKQAIEYYTKSLEIFMRFYGKDHPSTKTVKKNLEIARQ